MCGFRPIWEMGGLRRFVLPGWPSMLAKRMSELRVGYISIQADIE